MTRPSFVRSSLVLIVAAALATRAHAQRSEAEIRADIEYARGLASEWSFVDLATEVLDDARKKNPGGKLREELALAECEVYAQAARIEQDDARRNELFQAALDQYEDFLTRYPGSSLRSEAETGLVTTASNFSKSVDIALETATGEKAEELVQAKIDVLEAAVERSAELIAAIEDTPADERTARQLQDAASLMLIRGKMLGDMAAAQEGGIYFFEQAIVQLENMVFFFGEGSPHALRAYQAMGDVYLLRGDVESAYWMYEGVVNQAWPADPELLQRLIEEVEQSGATIEEAEWAQRYLFLEIAMDGLLECLNRLGRTEKACAFALHFYNARQQKGLNWTQAGYESLLACAETLLNAGGYVGGDLATGEARWFATEEEMEEAVRGRRNHHEAYDVALRFANIVNNDNKGSHLQLKAQKLISEIASRPGVDVSVDVLVQAAEGEFYDDDFDAAIQSFKRVLATLERRDTAEQLEYGGRVYNFLGNAYRQDDDRYLEAAMAFRAGVEANEEDPEYTSKNATGYRAMVKRLADAAPSDEVLRAELEKAEVVMLEYGQTATVDLVHYTNGKDAARQKNWDEAIEHYRKVDPGSNYGEKARVEIGVCTFRGGDPSRALAIFDEYLEFVQDQANPVESPVRKQKRAEAVATAEFYRGYIHYVRARKQDDPADWARVDEFLTGFPERHPQQDKLAPFTLRLVMEARLGAGERDRARQAFEQLLADHRDSSHTASASVTFYKTLDELRDQATGEEQRQILREMAELLKVANSILEPHFQRMRNESRHWMDLGEYGEAERILVRLTNEFGSEPEHQGTMNQHVLPDLGQVLLLNDKVDQAKAVLAPLVVPEDATPSKQTVLHYCRSVSGWLTGGGREPVEEVPGAGGSEEEWQAVVDNLRRIYGSERDAYSCPALQYRLMYLWAYYAWGREDSRKVDSAKNQFAQFEAPFGDKNFSEIDDACDQAEDEALRERLGGGVLQDRFQHLARLLR